MRRAVPVKAIKQRTTCVHAPASNTVTIDLDKTPLMSIKYNDRKILVSL